MNTKSPRSTEILALLLLTAALFSASCINRVDRWTGSPGIVLTVEEDITRIKKILPATLRGNGTLLEGDILYSVDGMQVSGTPLTIVGEALRGPVGTVVTVVVDRNSQYVTLKLERVIEKQPEIRVLWIEQVSVSTEPPPVKIPEGAKAASANTTPGNSR